MELSRKLFAEKMFHFTVFIIIIKSKDKWSQPKRSHWIIIINYFIDILFTAFGAAHSPKYGMRGIKFKEFTNAQMLAFESFACVCVIRWWLLTCINIATTQRRDEAVACRRNGLISCARAYHSSVNLDISVDWQTDFRSGRSFMCATATPTIIISMWDASVCACVRSSK